MANEAKWKVRETFDSKMRPYAYKGKTPLLDPRISEHHFDNKKFRPGDRVRVTVELLERRKRRRGN